MKLIFLNNPLQFPYGKQIFIGYRHERVLLLFKFH